jgi:hypothetical protein
VQTARKIITLDKSGDKNVSNHDSKTEDNHRSNNAGGGDVFDRLKKRPFNARDQSYLETDLETLIRKEGLNSNSNSNNNRNGQNNNLKSHNNSSYQGVEDIHKRLKKPDAVKPLKTIHSANRQLEEIKVNPTSNTVIDLS